MKDVIKKKHVVVSFVIICILGAGFALASFFGDFEDVGAQSVCIDADNDGVCDHYCIEARDHVRPPFNTIEVSTIANVYRGSALNESATFEILGTKYIWDQPNWDLFHGDGGSSCDAPGRMAIASYVDANGNPIWSGNFCGNTTNPSNPASGGWNALCKSSSATAAGINVDECLHKFDFDNAVTANDVAAGRLDLNYIKYISWSRGGCGSLPETNYTEIRKSLLDCSKIALSECTVDNCLGNTNPYQQDYVPMLNGFISGGNASGRAGTSVDMYGDKFILGAELVNLKGVANVYRHNSSGTWTSEALLAASDGAAYEHFGRSVALYDTTAVVGAPDNPNSTSAAQPLAGAAYVYRFNGTSWSEAQKLTASDQGSEDHFGESVAIDGNYIVVGAPGDDGGGTDSGSAYVYEYNGLSWVQQAKLTANDPAAGDNFGRSVAISGDNIIIGANGDNSGAGSVYIFGASSRSWSQRQKITANDAVAGDNFGRSVDIFKNTITVGAYLDDNFGGNDSGSIYIYKFGSSTWSQQQKLTASDASAGDRFGVSVSLGNNGNKVVVGSYLDDDISINSGAVYLFDFDTGSNSWIQGQKFTPQSGDIDSDIHFGYSVAAGGPNVKIVVGAPRDDTATNVEDYGSFTVYGNNVGDACENIVICGNGIVEGGEFCDDGNLNNEDECTNSCTVNGNFVGNNIDWLIIDTE